MQDSQDKPWRNIRNPGAADATDEYYVSLFNNKPYDVFIDLNQESVTLIVQEVKSPAAMAEMLPEEC